VGALERVGVGYIVSGSIASSLQGEPRSSHDADIVVELSPTDVLALARELESPDLPFDVAVALDAVRRRSACGSWSRHPKTPSS